MKSIPGVGMISAMEFLVELQDMTRFDSADDLAAFLGLTPSEHSSADRIRKGRITRCGNERVRRALVESSWTVIRYDASLRRKYQRLAKAKGSKKAIVAIAHTLAGRIRHMFITGESYKKAA